MGWAREEDEEQLYSFIDEHFSQRPYYYYCYYFFCVIVTCIRALDYLV